MFDKYTPAWVKVLKDKRWPTDVLVIDFETYFDPTFSMRSMATAVYVADPRFEVVSVAITHMNGETPFASYEQNTSFFAGEDHAARQLKYLQGEYGQNFERATVVIQNAKFDCTVLAKRYGIFPPQVVDLLGIARALHPRSLVGLGALCKRYGLSDKGDTSDFCEATFRTRFKKGTGRKKGPKMPIAIPKMTEAKVIALREYNVGDNLREWELFTLMLPLLSNPNTELALMQHTLELFTKPTLMCDFEHGTELVKQMEQRVVDAIPPGLTHDEISGNLSFEHLLNTAIIAAGDNPGAYHKWMKNGVSFALAKTDPEREKLLNHPDPTVRGLMEARVAIRSWPLHVSRVNGIMAMARACDGAMPVPLKYHGAHTGRWSGDEDINLQNMPKQGDPLLVSIRGLLVAPPGMMLVIADAAAIEARVLAWIAGEWWLVEKFANKQEIYCDFATKVLGWKVRKPSRKGSFIPAVEDKMEWARNSVGKIGVLGCGYGMGAEKTQSYAKGAIDYPTAERIVQTYRTEHGAIVQFWTDIEKAFCYVVRYRRSCDLPRGLRFDPYQETGVTITLPNGRELHYEACRIVPDPNRSGRDSLRVLNPLGHTWEHVWGGHLTENVVQAISRDILAEALLRLEAAGHHTAHHIHDELVIVSPVDQAKDVLKLAEAEIGQTPTWAPKMALGAEGVLSERYAKH